MNECGEFWNYGRVKTNYLEKYLSQDYVIHNKSHTEGLRIEPGSQYLPQSWRGSYRFMFIYGICFALAVSCTHGFLYAKQYLIYSQQ
jgi:hypothetical protein